MTTPPLEAPLVIPRGATWVVRWPVTDPVSGDPLDLTGWAVAGQVRAWYGAPVVLVDLDVICEAGQVVLSIAAANSLVWDFTEAVFGIELTNPGGDKIPLTQGPLMVSPRVLG